MKKDVLVFPCSVNYLQMESGLRGCVGGHRWEKKRLGLLLCPRARRGEMAWQPIDTYALVTGFNTLKVCALQCQWSSFAGWVWWCFGWGVKDGCNWWDFVALMNVFFPIPEKVGSILEGEWVWPRVCAWFCAWGFQSSTVVTFVQPKGFLWNTQMLNSKGFCKIWLPRSVLALQPILLHSTLWMTLKFSSCAHILMWWEPLDHHMCGCAHDLALTGLDGAPEHVLAGSQGTSDPHLASSGNLMHKMHCVWWGARRLLWFLAMRAG